MPGDQLTQSGYKLQRQVVPHALDGFHASAGNSFCYVATALDRNKWVGITMNYQGWYLHST